MKVIYLIGIIALLGAMMVIPVSATTETFSSVKDTWLDEFADGGNCDEIHEDMCAVSWANKNNRALIQFDVSSIPSGVTIDSATVHLYKLYVSENRINDIHRVTASWTESETTWNSRYTGTLWTTPGGDYVSTPTDSPSTGTTFETWMEWDVTSDVQDFVDGTPNDGWLIKDATEGASDWSGAAYATREIADPLRPYLEVTYTEGAADPDLTPTSIATDSLSAGVPAAITVNVSNIGSAEAGSFNVTLKVEETVIGSDTVASLGAGGSVPVVFTWTPDAAGTFNLTAIADSDDAVAESDETNNERTNEVTVTPAAATTWDVYPDNSSDSIRNTINSASDGDTIFFHAGTYVLTGGVGDWRLLVDTPNITLKGEGVDVVTLDGMGKPVIYIGAWEASPGCVVEGFRIVNGSVGVAVANAESPNCIIRNNVFDGMSTAIGAAYSPNTTIKGNVIDGLSKYIEFRASPVTFVDNVVSNSTKTYASVKFYIPDAVIVNNTFINNVAGMGIYNNEATNITVVRNNFISSGAGIKLYGGASGNRIYLNNFVDNTESVSIGGSGTPANIWNSTEPIEYTHNGVIHTGYLGNYWSDYTGEDTSPEDGIGDDAYQIAASTDYDYRPLMESFENYLGEEAADPDLTPTSIANDSLSAGVPAAITVNVSNIGSGDAGSFNVSLKVEDTVIGSDTVASLGAGSSVPVVFTWTPDAAGSFNLTAIVDSDDAVAESDEANNERTREVTVEETSTPTPPTSFLISGNITYDNGNPVMNPAVTVTNLATSEDFTVKTDAGSNYYLTLTDSTHVTAGDTIRINTSDGSASSETDHPVTASEITTGGFVQDMTIESGDLPDLTVTEKSEEWISLADGTYNVTCTVANIGTSGADASTTAIEIDGTVVATDPVPALAIGESHTSTLGPFTLSGENDTIRVCADSGESINELDETNNCLENVLEAPSMPDLIVWVALKTPGYVNEDNILGVRVKNTGTGGAGSFNVSLAIDGTPMPGQTVPSLAGGETTELEYAWTPTELGGHALSATVDTNNDVEESDEANNDYARTSVIISSTDWAQFNYDASGIGFSPSSAPSSDTVKWISEDIGAGGGLSWGGISDMGPVVADGKIFTYGGAGGVSATTYDVACVNEETGELLWNITLPYQMVYGSWAPLGYDDGMVFCTVNHYVVALDADDGSIVWECDLDSPDFEGHAWSVNSGPTIADGMVFAGTYDEGGIGGTGGLAGYVAIDEYTGEKLWQTTGDGHCDSTPAYYDGVVYAGFDYDWTASPSGGCYALNASTGEEVWTAWLPFSIWGSVSVDEDYVYGANYNFYGPAQVFILYRNNGTVKVISESLRTDSTPAVAYGNIYICGGCQGYSDTGTFCVDKETLEVLWSAPAGSWTASPAVADGKVYVGGFCYDAFTGEEIFSYEQGGLSPVIANGCLFNVQDGRVVCFEDSPTDLTVSAIETPANLRNDVINPVTATIENLGGFDAGSFDVSLAVDDIPVDTASVTSLAAGENTTVEFLWTPSSTGNQALTVTADISDAVTESDESNNNLSQTADVLEKLTVTANVRIEGKNDTVWTGDVTFSNSTITASDGSIHYLNEPTALGALDEADRIGGFGYVVVDYEWGLYVEEVAEEPPIGWDGWMYRVNYISPSFGAPDYTLVDNDEVLWYFGKMWPSVPPLTIELDRTTVMTGQEFVATVTAETELVDNATVYADGLMFQTGPDGKATLALDTAGNYTVYADKGTWAEYTRSEKETVTVVVMPAGVTFNLKKLNLNSNGILMAFITLPEGYDVADIDVSTVECEGAHVFGDGSIIPGKQALAVKFKIPDLVDVQTGDAISLSVTGELTTGERFEGSNTVEVIKKEKGKK